MGVYNAELFSNLGLCCFFAQQYDMTLNCFERALALASDENMADVWYNIGHVAVVNNVSFLLIRPMTAFTLETRDLFKTGFPSVTSFPSEFENGTGRDGSVFTKSLSHFTRLLIRLVRGKKKPSISVTNLVALRRFSGRIERQFYRSGSKWPLTLVMVNL